MILIQSTETEVIEPIAHEQLLWLFLMLTVLLVVARGLGEVAKYFDLPAVVGELSAGILLGPSVIDATSIVFRSVFSSGTPIDPQFHLVEVVSWIGLLMLIILTGLETDLDLIISRGVDATIISIASIVVPFAMGFAFAWYLPDRFIAGPGQRLVFSLFVGTALSISAIPVIAKILMDMGAIRRDFGQISLAVGMINDTVGWILLALVAGLARTGQIELADTALTIIYLVIFLGFGLTVGQRVVAWIVRTVDDTIGGQVAKLTTLMALALGVGSFTHYLHLEAVLGAFVVGILVGQVKRFDYETEHTFEMLTIGVFAPIFFATAGLRVNLRTLADPAVLAVATAALGIAIVGKFVGSYVGAKIAGLSHWEGVTLGAGLNARGAMEIIVAMIGLGLGVLTIEMYSIIVVIAVVTSLMAPPLLRWSLPHVPMSDEEQARLEREEQEAESFLGRMTTVLLPTRCGIDSQYAARILGSLTHDQEIDVTHMYIDQPIDHSANPSRTNLSFDRQSLLAKVPGMGSQKRDESASSADAVGTTDPAILNEGGKCLDVMQDQFDPSDEQNARTLIRQEVDSLKETVLSEAREDYDMLVLGSAERGARPNDPPFGELMDSIIRDSPCPVTVVHANAKPDGVVLQRKGISRILLPTVGAEYNRHAAEVAFEIAKTENALVEIVHVVNKSQVSDRFIEEPDIEEARKLGEQIVDGEADLGRRLGAEVTTSVIVSEQEPEDEIVRLARENDDDLVVMGASLRPVSRRAFFGHRAEYVIRNADCAVAVVCSV